MLELKKSARTSTYTTAADGVSAAGVVLLTLSSMIFESGPLTLVAISLLTMLASTVYRLLHASMRAAEEQDDEGTGS